MAKVYLGCFCADTILPCQDLKSMVVSQIAVACVIYSADIGFGNGFLMNCA